MIPSGDRIVPPLSAAALADPERGLKNVDAARPAARPYRHGGERPRARALLDAADRLAARFRPAIAVSTPARSFDWRVPAIWAVAARRLGRRAYLCRGRRRGASRPCRSRSAARWSIEMSSHLVVAALLPALYWLHRRWPIGGAAAQPADPCRGGRAVQPRCIRSAWRRCGCLWFSGIVGDAVQLSAHPRPAGLRVRQGHRLLRAAERRRRGAAPSAAAPGAGAARGSAAAGPAPAGTAARALRGPQARRQRDHGRDGRHRLDRGLGQLRHPPCRRRDLRDPLLAHQARRRARSQAVRAGAQIPPRQHRPGGRSDAVGERRLAHPPAGRRRGEPEPPLSPALRGRWCR